MDKNNAIPYGELGLIVFESVREIGERIDKLLIENRGMPEAGSYIIPIKEIRFSNGEGKIFIEESVRGKDIYLISDIGNYSITYNMFGYENRKSPDDHMQDIKRVLSAMAGKARRSTVIMPLLYSSRQHSRKGRESLDCAMALQELERLGVEDILTFDAHDPTIQNAIPLISFENLYPTFEIVKAMINKYGNLLDHKDETLIISPDTGAMDRAIYYSSVLGYDIGLFYKRRDHSKVVGGKNPIVQHEYIGKDVEGKNILIVDDMIASGESVFDIADELKEKGAAKIFVSTTFALFTEGISKFDAYFAEGKIDQVFSTNLSYIPDYVHEREWFSLVDMSEFIFDIINHLNHDQSISKKMDATYRIQEFLNKR